MTKVGVGGVAVVLGEVDLGLLGALRIVLLDLPQDHLVISAVHGVRRRVARVCSLVRL